jgi:hypothetical protein
MKKPWPIEPGILLGITNKKRRRYRRRSWCTSRGPAHFDWRWRERPVLALLAWDTYSRSVDQLMPPWRFDLPLIHETV